MTELEKATTEYRNFRESCGYKDPVALNEIEDAFFAGAEWQKEQFENNRIATCDNMTKAEQYINDYTRNCSNELSNGEYESWLTPDHALRAAEIAKKETIDKACEWLESNVEKYIYNDTPYPDADFKACVGGKCWEYFRKAMKGE